MAGNVTVNQALQLDKRTKHREQLGTYGLSTQIHKKKKFMNKREIFSIGRGQMNKPTQYEPAENSVFMFSLNVSKVYISFGK